MAVVVDTDACIACAACVDACPLGSLTVEDTCTVDADSCCECGACLSSCPTDALSL